MVPSVTRTGHHCPDPGLGNGFDRKPFATPGSAMKLRNVRPYPGLGNVFRPKLFLTPGSADDRVAANTPTPDSVTVSGEIRR